MKSPSAKTRCLLVLLALNPAFASGALDPEVADRSRAVVEALHTGLAAAGHSGGSREERYAALAPLVARTHDLAFIGERSIRRVWSELDEGQRQAFLAAFERMSVMTYATRFDSADEDSFVIHEVLEAGSGRVQVKAAVVRAADTDIPLDYVLHDAGSGWRIINILADGVSDLALKRAEYQRVLSQGTIEDLVDYLNEQTESLD